MTPEQEMQGLKEINADLKRRFLLEQDSNIRTANYALSLEKKYEEALEELMYREEYFGLYESKIWKFLTKTKMKLKMLKGKMKKGASK